MSTTYALLATAPSALTAAGWALAARRAARLGTRLHTDALTGLAIRAGLAARLAEVRPGAGSVGLLLLDLDEFKPVNDSYGHAEGDRVLRHVAAQLTTATRPGELAVRLHGDEFAVLLGAVPTGSHTDATARAGAIAQAVAEPLVTDRGCHRVTASVGAAMLPAAHADLSTLLAVADRAMYATKPARTRRPVVAA